ncbi:MAG TPA: hypothetical protein VN669_04085 [Candidatus Acidoferrales bacterium]|nr:hypothetical protein [Candidatus Acidoferrales bacterium]
MATKPEKSLRVSLWARYEDALAPIASRLPANARKYALAAWHCDVTDHRCIHDAWIEAISVVESGVGPRKEKRGLGIVMRLLGAHQDRYLILKFPGVRRYRIEHSFIEGQRRDGVAHGDVLDDSIQLTSKGTILYSMRMEFGGVEIEAKDVEFSQLPIS